MNLIHGDCIEEMRKLETNSIDACVTDPPYGLSFMGKKWDHDVPEVEVWKEVLRVLKPGGYLLSFAGTRTQHRMAVNIEDAGFEIRDMIAWVYGSGFPKSLNIGKQIDKMNGKTQEEFIALGKYLREKRGNIPQNKISKFFPSKTGKLTGCVSNWELGMNVPTKEQWIILKRELNLDNKFDYLIDRIEAEREVIGKDGRGELKEDMFFTQNIEKAKEQGKSIGYGKWDITKAKTNKAKEWEGWGTALKPALEPITVARKPLDGTVAQNVLKHGTGGINIDECRIDHKGEQPNLGGRTNAKMGGEGYGFKAEGRPEEANNKGRFPANLIHDGSEEVLNEFPDTKSGDNCIRTKEGNFLEHGGPGKAGDLQKTYGDEGSAARYFYCAKASKSERNYGLDGFDVAAGMWKDKNAPHQNHHPTVKPLALMRYLVRLVTPPKGTVLDPFAGSFTTGMAAKLEGFDYILIERDKEYFKIGKARVETISEVEIKKGELILPEVEIEGQPELF